MTKMDWDKLRRERQVGSAAGRVEEYAGPVLDGRRALRSKYDGRCADCREPFGKGTWIWWRPGSSLCEACGAVDPWGNVRLVPREPSPPAARPKPVERKSRRRRRSAVKVARVAPSLPPSGDLELDAARAKLAAAGFKVGKLWRPTPPHLRDVPPWERA